MTFEIDIIVTSDDWDGVDDLDLVEPDGLVRPAERAIFQRNRAHGRVLPESRS